MPVCLSVCRKQLGSQWIHFDSSLYITQGISDRQGIQHAWERRRMHIGFGGKQKERDHWRDIDVGGRKIRI
jgi:hypothetical protein